MTAAPATAQTLLKPPFLNYQLGRAYDEIFERPGGFVSVCRHFRREMRGLSVPRDVYVSLCGTDLARLPDGSFAVLEDNLRVPSGVSYMLANRKVLKRVFPTLFRDYGVCSVDHYAQALLATLRSLAPAGCSSRNEPTTVLLTPGVSNSSYFA